MKNYEYYDVTCQKNGNTPETYEDAEIFESFRVRAASHIQHAPGSTTLCGVSRSAVARIARLRGHGCMIRVVVGGRSIILNPLPGEGEA